MNPTTRPITKPPQSIHEKYPHGLFIPGTYKDRSLEEIKNWRKVFHDYLSFNQKPGTEYRGIKQSYLTAWTYNEAFTDYFHANNNRSTGYGGIHYGRFLIMDFDRKIKFNQTTENAIAEAQEVLKRCEKLGANLEEIIACFSGNRGAHIYIPLPSIAMPSPYFNDTCKALAMKLAEGLPSLDETIYSRVRLFRLPNTRHPIGKKFNVPYLGSEFIKLSPAQIAKGEKRRAVKFPANTSSKWLIELWKESVEESSPMLPEEDEEHSDPFPTNGTLSASTVDFIAFGAPEGTRNNSLYKSGCDMKNKHPPEEIIATLTPPALKCGLPQSEITATLNSALYGKKSNNGKAQVSTKIKTQTQAPNKEKKEYGIMVTDALVESAAFLTLTYRAQITLIHMLRKCYQKEHQLKEDVASTGITFTTSDLKKKMPTLDKSSLRRIRDELCKVGFFEKDNTLQLGQRGDVFLPSDNWKSYVSTKKRSR